MGLWAYWKERSEYQGEVKRAREALSEILDLSYEARHLCPDDIEAKVAIRCIGFEAINDPKPPLSKLRQAFDDIARHAESISARRAFPDLDLAANGIRYVCFNWKNGGSSPCRK